MTSVNGIFYTEEFSERFLDEIKRLLEILDSPRAGALFPETFEDGVRYVYLQILQDSKRCKEIVDCYTKLRKLQIDEGYIYHDLRNKYYEKHLENLKDRKQTSDKHVFKMGKMLGLKEDGEQGEAEKTCTSG